MDSVLPFEVLIRGTPASAQTQSAKGRERWKNVVGDACRSRLPEQHWLVETPLFAILLYFPSAPMEGDVHNIVKYTLDGMKRVVFLDDRQIEKILVQKFEPGFVTTFNNPSSLLLEALEAEPPIMYVRLSENIYEAIP